MRRLGHRADIGHQPTGARRADTEGVLQLLLIEFQQVGGGYCRTHEADAAWRMDGKLAGRVLVGGQPNMSLELAAFDKSRDNLSARSLSIFGQGENGRQRWRCGVGGRTPHRLIVQNVHGDAVGIRCQNGRGSKAVANNGRRFFSALTFDMRDGNGRPRLSGSGHRNGKAVEDDPLGNRNSFVGKRRKSHPGQGMTQGCCGLAGRHTSRLVLPLDLSGFAYGWKIRSWKGIR